MKIKTTFENLKSIYYKERRELYLKTKKKKWTKAKREPLSQVYI